MRRKVAPIRGRLVNAALLVAAALFHIRRGSLLRVQRRRFAFHARQW